MLQSKNDIRTCFSLTNDVIDGVISEKKDSMVPILEASTMRHNTGEDIRTGMKWPCRATVDETANILHFKKNTLNMKK